MAGDADLHCDRQQLKREAFGAIIEQFDAAWNPNKVKPYQAPEPFNQGACFDTM